MNKIKVTFLHLFLSLLIVTSVISAMYFLWFPKAYFLLMGGNKLIILIGFIDVFVGPLLTFILFKPGKKGLKFDLYCVAIIQVIALTYGANVMLQARPIFTVFNKDQFQVAAVVDITPEELAKAKKPQWQHPSLTGPQLVAIGNPNKNDKELVAFAATVSNYAVRYPKLYDEYDNHRKEVIKAGKPLSRLTVLSDKNKITVARFIKESHRQESDFLFLPIVSLLEEMSVIVDANTADLIEIIDANPELMAITK